jgi:hypothetical protein
MKKPWLLILAGIILTTLIGLWLYLFFGGDEAKEDLYNAFGLDGGDLPFGIDDFLNSDSASSSAPYLRQLSLRQTIGYIPLSSSSTPPVVYLAEAGTGYIYKVDVATGQEERLSNITIPSAREASFSPDGIYAAITSNDGRTLTLVTLPHASNTLSSTVIDGSPISAVFTTDSTLLYAVKEGQSVKGYAYTTDSGESELVFTIPFREAHILWGDNVNGPHYVYPKTAESLEGYLYEISSGTLKRLPVSGFGLSAQVSNFWILYTKYKESIPESYVYGKGRIKIPVIPEKCAAADDAFFCGASSDSTNITEWYRGQTTSSDSLWYVVPEINYVNSIEDISTTAGRSIDIVNIQPTDVAVYFINKVDAGLWVYERDFTSPLTDN